MITDGAARAKRRREDSIKGTGVSGGGSRPGTPGAGGWMDLAVRGWPPNALHLAAAAGSTEVARGACGGAWSFRVRCAVWASLSASSVARWHKRQVFARQRTGGAALRPRGAAVGAGGLIPSQA